MRPASVVSPGSTSAADHLRMSEGRPNSSRRGYDAAWRRRRAAQLERQPWCELDAERAVRAAFPDANQEYVPTLVAALLEVSARATGPLPPRAFASAGVLVRLADTVDHRKPRRTFQPPELQGSDAPGGSEHPDNLRSLCHSCHSRRGEDKARRAT